MDDGGHSEMNIEPGQLSKTPLEICLFCRFKITNSTHEKISESNNNLANLIMCARNVKI